LNIKLPSRILWTGLEKALVQGLGFVQGILLMPLIAGFYREPTLVPLVRVMGIGIVLNAACAVGGAQVQRTQRFRELSTVNVVSSLTPMLLAVVLAWRGAGVWAVVLTVIRASGHSEKILQADVVKKPLVLLALAVGANFGLYAV